MKHHNYLRNIVFAVLASGLVSSALAQSQVVVPTDVEASSEFDSARAASDTFDFGGFTNPERALIENGDPVPSPWPTVDDFGLISWLSGSESSISDAFITFDLGSVQSLDGVHIWNYNLKDGNGSQDFIDRGVQDFNIELSSTGSDLSSATGFSSIGSFTLAQGPGNDTYEGETIAFTGSARFVRFDIQSNYGWSDLVGLNEVRFTAVPEPATFGLLGGFAVFACAMLRRRSR